MHVGSHGGSHYWLNKLTYNEQKKDLVKSLNFFNMLEHQFQIGYCVILTGHITSQH